MRAMIRTLLRAQVSGTLAPIRRGRRKQAEASLSTLIRINENIRSDEVRVLTDDGDNLGVLPLKEAIERAKQAGLDLIEVSGKANPPVAKIGDFGRYVYEQKKKLRDTKAKARATATETKSVQVKIGTGASDLDLKANRAAKWLAEGHRVKVDLFLWGRYKYMEFSFLKERLERFLKLIPHDFKISDEIAKGPKGLTVTIERDLTKKKAKDGGSEPASRGSTQEDTA